MNQQQPRLQATWGMSTPVSKGVFGGTTPYPLQMITWRRLQDHHARPQHHHFEAKETEAPRGCKYYLSLTHFVLC